MNKSTYYSGQPIFSQLIRFIPKGLVFQAAIKYHSDKYCKRFDTWSHLVTMLYTVLQQCNSLREVTTGMSACEGKLQSLGLSYFPKRSTLSDANSRRSSDLFEEIYQQLYYRLRDFLPDSRLQGSIYNKLIILDSTTITLFSNILKAAGRPPDTGRKKGGIKVHMAVRHNENVPYLVRMSESAKNDVKYLLNEHFPKGSYVVFDRGYNSFNHYNRLTQGKVNWVTRLRTKTRFTVQKSNNIRKQHRQAGIISDQQIIMGHQNKAIPKVKCRLIKFYDKQSKRAFEFVTNNNSVSPLTVAELYRKRWSIELLFKRLKQNLQLQYFLGDNENAIRIQIWCVLIADLLLRVNVSGIKRKWAFSNLAALIRLHLMNYTDLRRFLEQPDKTQITSPVPPVTQYQLKLFNSG